MSRIDKRWHNIMTGPQLENGYTKIANELLEQFAKFRIPGESRQILDVIIRKTYGYNRKDARIALGLFSELTGLKRQNVQRAIKWLLNANLVLKSDAYFVNSYSINKNYTHWTRPIKEASKASTPVLKSEYKLGIALESHKRKKENILKDKVILFEKDNPETTEIVKAFIDTLETDELKFAPQNDTQKLKWLKCAKWAIKRMGEHGQEKVIDIITVFRDPNDITSQNWAGWPNQFKSLLKLQTKNKQDLFYLDLFYDKIKERCTYGS